MINLFELNKLIRKYTGFKSFDDLVNARGNYVPTIRLDANPEMRPIAEAYDEYQAAAGNLKRAFVTYPKREQKRRDKISVAMFKGFNRVRRIERERRVTAAELVTLNAAHTEALKMNREHITTRHGIALNINAAKDRQAAMHANMIAPTTPVELAKSVKYLAKKMINDARRDRRYNGRPHFTQRGIEVLAITDGERTGNGEPSFLEMNQISGKALKEVVADMVKYFDEDTIEEICIQGGLDAYESFRVFMEDSKAGYADYDPMVEEFDITVPLSLFK